MPRAIAIMVALSLLGMAGHLSRLHTHAYGTHDHPEHQHDLASHEHRPAVPHDDKDEGSVHLEPCEPEQHAVSFTVGRALVPHVTACVAAPATNPATVKPLVFLSSIRTPADVRVHGPPPIAPFGPRAPPLTLPA